MITLFREWVTNTSGNYDVNYGEPKEEVSEIVKNTLEKLKEYLEDASKKDICAISYDTLRVYFGYSDKVESAEIYSEIDDHTAEKLYFLAFNKNVNRRHVVDGSKLPPQIFNITKYEYDLIFNLIRHYYKIGLKRKENPNLVLDEIVPSRKDAKKFNM